jgi:DNA-binding GntR family transcriptional regulator
MTILPTPLQRDLAERILGLMRERGLTVGDRLSENGLSRELNVSRTPIRAALAHLADRGIVQRRPHLGVELVTPPPLPPARSRDASAGVDEDSDLLVLIARDRRSGTLGDAVSEAELMRRYGVARPVLQRVLRQLAESGMLERKPGYGWRFLASPLDIAARHESYRLRALLEPLAILEPEFRLAPDWIAHMRREHEATTARPWRRSSSVAFFEMNAAFHEGIAAGSGNRYILAAIRRQNELRRFSNYDWVYGTERVAVNCREHLAILDRLAEGDRELAALLLRRHIESAMQVRPPESTSA